MKQYKYPFQSTIDIQFENRDIAELVYYSIYPDIKKTHSKYFKINMYINANSIKIKVSADSIGKFRGIYKTILRLLNLINQFIKLDYRD